VLVLVRVSVARAPARGAARARGGGGGGGGVNLDCSLLDAVGVKGDRDKTEVRKDTYGVAGGGDGRIGDDNDARTTKMVKMMTPKQQRTKLLFPPLPSMPLSPFSQS